MTEPGEASGWERLFWLVFDRSSNPVVLLDEERRIVDVNDAAALLLRTTRDALVSSSMAESIKPSERAEAQEQWEDFLKSGEYAGTRELIRADGSQERVTFAASLAKVGERRLAVYVITTSQEPTECLDESPELPLTDREREIVTLIALGRETPEIAAELHISAETVRSHVRNAMGKLGAHTRAQLVATALCAGHALDDRPFEG
jgi:PAS domain S-box-containing protein